MRVTARSSRAAIGAALLLSGCGAGWSQVPVAPAALASEPTEVRATMADGSRVVVAMPRIEGDSLFGEVDGTARAIAIADVQRLALPIASRSRRSAGTVAVATALAVLAAGWAILILGNY